MRPEAFLDVADELAEGQAPRLRSAVSRAYYAVYHVASRATYDLGGPSRSSSHDLVGNRFQSSSDPDISELGQRFLNLKAARHRADYKLADGMDVENLATVGVLVREARVLVHAFEHLPHGDLRGAAVEAIAAYEKMYRGG